MGAGGGRNDEKIKEEIESKEWDPECLKFISRSELSWSAAKPTAASSLNYVHSAEMPSATYTPISQGNVGNYVVYYIVY